MIRRLLLSVFCCICAFYAKAGIETTDQITISKIQVAPGGDAKYFTVSLNGGNVENYTAYQIELVMPEGLSVAYNDNNEPCVSMRKTSGIYPGFYDEDNDETTYTHILNSEYKERILKVMCYSSKNHTFAATTGELFRVYVKASPYMKPGETVIQTQNIYFTTNDEKQYDLSPASYSITIGSTSQVSINISAAHKWNTCVLPFDAALPDGVRAFEGNRVSGEYLILSEVSSLQAYTPYILYAENGYTGTWQGTVDEEKYVSLATGSYLCGAIMPQEITQGYVLQNQGEGMMFYNVNNRSFTIPSGKCWVVADGKAKAIRMGFGETGLDPMPAALSADAPIYTLDGKRISTPQKGNVYIIGGKKVLYLE